MVRRCFAATHVTSAVASRDGATTRDALSLSEWEFVEENYNATETHTEREESRDSPILVRERRRKETKETKRVVV